MWKVYIVGGCICSWFTIIYHHGVHNHQKGVPEQLSMKVISMSWIGEDEMDVPSGGVREVAVPTTDFWGCYYHSLKLWWENIGLQVAYREDANVNWFLQRIAALVFMPVRFVRLAWQDSCCSTIALSRDRKLQELKERFDTNKIKLEARNVCTP